MSNKTFANEISARIGTGLNRLQSKRRRNLLRTPVKKESARALGENDYQGRYIGIKNVLNLNFLGMASRNVNGEKMDRLGVRRREGISIDRK